MSTSATRAADAERRRAAARQAAQRSQRSQQTNNAPSPNQIKTPEDFAKALLQKLGAPQTQANINSIVNWEAREGGHWHNTARFNPLNTTQNAPGSTTMNGVGVRAYTSWQQGIQATVDTLNNGHYGDIVAALKSGRGLTGNIQGLSTWSGGGYSSLSTGPSSYANTTGGGQAPSGSVPVSSGGGGGGGGVAAPSSAGGVSAAPSASGSTGSTSSDPTSSTASTGGTDPSSGGVRGSILDMIFSSMLKDLMANLDPKELESDPEFQKFAKSQGWKPGQPVTKKLMKKFLTKQLKGMKGVPVKDRLNALAKRYHVQLPSLPNNPSAAIPPAPLGTNTQLPSTT